MNLQSFERQGHLVNDLLFEKKLFLKIYELRKKNWYVFKKGYEKSEVIKEISSFVKQRFNGFTISSHMLEKKEPIDIVYKAVKSINENIEFFFTDEIRLAYHAHYQEGKSSISLRSRTTEQCYYYGIFVVGQAKLQ